MITLTGSEIEHYLRKYEEALEMSKACRKEEQREYWLNESIAHWNYVVRYGDLDFIHNWLESNKS